MSLSTTYPPCPITLTTAEIEQYHRDGYLAFTDVLSAEEVQASKASLSSIVERLRHEHRTLKNSYGRVWGSGSVMIQFEQGYEPTGADDPEAELKVRKFHDFVGVDEHLTFLARAHEKIQGVLNCLIGSDPLLMQNMALVKPPFFGSEKPWHQDDAYFKVAPLEAVCGVWIALDEAGEDNGCMHVLPGGHKVGALRHYHGKDCEIVPDRLQSGAVDVRNAVPVPLPAGGALFFSGILPHQTPPNISAERRRALQFHYRSQDSRIVDETEYDGIFVEQDGSPASCTAAARRGF